MALRTFRLNILREDWKPVLNLNAVIVGLQVRCPRQGTYIRIWLTDVYLSFCSWNQMRRIR